MHRQLAVGRADIARVAHGVAVLLLAEDLPDGRVGTRAQSAGLVAPPFRGPRLIGCHDRAPDKQLCMSFAHDRLLVASWVAPSALEHGESRIDAALDGAVTHVAMRPATVPALETGVSGMACSDDMQSCQSRRRETQSGGGRGGHGQDQVAYPRGLVVVETPERQPLL